jgi:F-type H+-transporting ATPase subunit epsilon
MKSFILKLQDATRSEEIEQVTSFVGEDLSGSFGILAGHARMMASLVIGLARFRIREDNWTTGCTWQCPGRCCISTTMY